MFVRIHSDSIDHVRRVLRRYISHMNKSPSDSFYYSQVNKKDKTNLRPLRNTYNEFMYLNTYISIVIVIVTM